MLLVFVSLDQEHLPCCQYRRRLIPPKSAIGWPSRGRSTGDSLLALDRRSRDQIGRGGICQHVAC